MAEVPQELKDALTSLLASAIKAALPTALAEAANNQGSPGATGRSKFPSFTMKEYCSSDGTTVEDYFTRFKWALELSNIPDDQHAKFARVHMGSELNDALKFLVAPKNPEELLFTEICNTLIKHFDKEKNKFAESVKFRLIRQHKGESIASFALRLRQGAAHCEYGEFLDRMLIEQLLHGLIDRNSCDEIIAKKPETFKAAYEIAHALEATRQTGDEVKTDGPRADSTHALSSKPLQIKNGTKSNRSRSMSRGRQGSQSTKQGPKIDATEDLRRPCNGCGGSHRRSHCPFRDAECHSCRTKGHIAKVCRKKQPVNAIKVLQPTEFLDTTRCIKKIESVNALRSEGKAMLQVKLNRRNFEMELDTAAASGITGSEMLRTVLPQFESQLIPSDKQFADYSHNRLHCLGRIEVEVALGQTTKNLFLYVIEGNYDSLFGRDWIQEFVHEINWSTIFKPQAIHTISTSSSTLTPLQESNLNRLLKKYDDVFSDKAGKLIGPPVKAHFKPNSAPIFAKAREIPFALRDAYSKEIEKKIDSGLYERVDYSEWASTTHIVAKKNGKIRITGNYKPTLNPRLIIDEHPIPKPEHLFHKTKGSKVFCLLDVTDAYSHLVVDEEFSHALTLNTPTHGLVRPKRAVYGAANIPAIWQRTMESILKDVDNAISFFDDILLFAETFDQLLVTVEEVLQRFRTHGIHLNRDKCKFAESSVEFLGHKIDALGLHKSDKHIEAIRDAPKPTTPDQLELFLGKATYYSSFIPDLSTKARPLRDMLTSDSFEWTSAAKQAFADLKNILISPQVLMPYDPKLPLVLATDASSVGLGAVLSHRLADNSERPIAYASRTMTTTEQRYPQIDKEALSIVWAVNKFFIYLYARHFTLITDHKPLTQILHPDKSLPVLCISRMANYADYLSHFDFDVIYKNTKENTNADYCSRAPLPTTLDRVHQIVVEEEGKIRC